VEREGCASKKKKKYRETRKRGKPSVNHCPRKTKAAVTKHFYTLALKKKRTAAPQTRTQVPLQERGTWSSCTAKKREGRTSTSHRRNCEEPNDLFGEKGKESVTAQRKKRKKKVTETIRCEGQPKTGTVVTSGKKIGHRALERDSPPPPGMKRERGEKWERLGQACAPQEGKKKVEFDGNIKKERPGGEKTSSWRCHKRDKSNCLAAPGVWEGGKGSNNNKKKGKE